MKEIKIGGKSYTLEFTFEAATYQLLIQKMFNIASGSSLAKASETADNEVEALMSGFGDLISCIANVCPIAFYAGMLENNPVSVDDAKVLMKQYMKENKLNFKSLYDELLECMEDDGFFELSGITDTVDQITDSMEEEPAKVVPMPQDHKKKAPAKKTSTKTKTAKPTSEE